MACAWDVVALLDDIASELGVVWNVDFTIPGNNSIALRPFLPSQRASARTKLFKRL